MSARGFKLYRRTYGLFVGGALHIMAAYNGMHMVDRTIDYFEPPAVQSGATLEQRAATPFSTPAEDAPKRLAYCAGALLAAEAYRKIKCEKRINSEWWKVHKYITR